MKGVINSNQKSYAVGHLCKMETFLEGLKLEDYGGRKTSGGQEKRVGFKELISI